MLAQCFLLIGGGHAHVVLSDLFCRAPVLFHSSMEAEVRRADHCGGPGGKARPPVTGQGRAARSGFGEGAFPAISYWESCFLITGRFLMNRRAAETGSSRTHQKSTAHNSI